MTGCSLCVPVPSHCADMRRNLMTGGKTSRLSKLFSDCFSPHVVRQLSSRTRNIRWRLRHGNPKPILGAFAFKTSTARRISTCRKDEISKLLVWCRPTELCLVIRRVVNRGTMNQQRLRMLGIPLQRASNVGRRMVVAREVVR